MTLAVLNTVPGAQEVYRRLRCDPVPVTLLHSQFRGVERTARLADILRSSSSAAAASASASASAASSSAAAADRIVILTRDVLSGLDLPAAALVSEALPSPAAGEVPVIGAADFPALFDTSLALSDADVDVARYVRDADDLDVEVAWATWATGQDGAPDPEVRHPASEFRCRVPAAKAVKLAESGQSGGSTARRGSGGGLPKILTGLSGRMSCCSSTRRMADTTRKRASTRHRGIPFPEAPSWPWPSPRAGRRGNGSRSTSTASRSATRRPRCLPCSRPRSRQRQRAPLSSPATCTTPGRPTPPGKTRSAPWPKSPPRPR